MTKLLIVVFVILFCSGMVYSSSVATLSEAGPLVDDFTRTDIPATLEECYAALDTLLDEATKEDIKTSSGDELIGNYHFGLGMWIRNNWIYPAADKIAKVFLDAGIDHPDDMSSIILEGYRSYLNGLAYEITP